RVVNTVRGPLQPVRRVVDSRRIRITLVEKLPVALSESLDASGERLATGVGLLIRQFRLGLREQQVQIVTEIQPLPTPAAEEVSDLQPRHAARPGEEAQPPVELAELLPEDQGRLLEEVVRVVHVPDER